MKKRIQYVMAIALVMFGLTAVDLSAKPKVVYVRKAPPARKRVVVKPTRPKYKTLWVDGHWHWDGKAYIWKNGHWVKARKNKIWVPGHWKTTPKGHMWIDGRWKRK